MAGFNALRNCFLATCGLTQLPLLASSVDYAPGSGAQIVLFEKSDGSELDGGYMFLGTFASVPELDISMADVLTNFQQFAGLDSNPSTPAGFFSDSTFTGLLSDFESSHIYTLVVDTADPALATEYCVFSSSLSNWTFQASELDLSPSILLTEVDQYFAGVSDTIENPDGIPGTFKSIQLASVGPPEPPILPEIRHVIVSGQPGIEFDFPTADAGTVEFILQESVGDTLLEPSWTDVVATPSVISDDGTTQVIQILYPGLVSEDTEQFLRLKGTSL